jgi:hypothetical protein
MACYRDSFTFTDLQSHSSDTSQLCGALISVSSFFILVMVVSLVNSSYISFWFYLNRQMNMQDNRYWNTENSHHIHEILLHDVKIDICYTHSARRIMGSVSYTDTFNSEICVRQVLLAGY